MDDIHREQENAKDAELRLLQEQINPHFLYNKLDAIIWMTESGENKKAISDDTGAVKLFQDIVK